MRKDVKDLINKRKIAFVYLMHRMFEGNPTMLLKTMRVPQLTIGDLQDWDSEFRDAVYATIQEEDLNGVSIREKYDIPSIKSIKEKVLRRCYDLISETTDPAKLAMVYKVLSEFETADDKKEESVLDAITKSLQPRSPKKPGTVTMLDKMRSEGLAPAIAKRGPGRPRKVQEPVEEVSEVEESIEEPEEEETINE